MFEKPYSQEHFGPFCGRWNQLALIVETNENNSDAMVFRSNDGLEEQGFNASYFAISQSPNICE